MKIKIKIKIGLLCPNLDQWQERQEGQEENKCQNGRNFGKEKRKVII